MTTTPILRDIPTHVIAGPLGAGKTSVIRHLMSQRPSHERWAVLINEFGQVGLDAALLANDDDGIALAEVAGGCLCCLNGVPFQTGLARLLRKARPQRLFIEPSGLGHPMALMTQLEQAPWTGILAVQPLVTVVDARDEAFLRENPQISVSGLLIINKIDLVDKDNLLLSKDFLKNIAVMSTTFGVVDIRDLPTRELSTRQSNIDQNIFLNTGEAAKGTLWKAVDIPLVDIREATDGWTIGWRWHPHARFDLIGLSQILSTMDWRRAKAVVHGIEGWQSINAVSGESLEWRTSEWRRDTRLELIFSYPQDAGALTQAVTACLAQ